MDNNLSNFNYFNDDISKFNEFIYSADTKKTNEDRQNGFVYWLSVFLSDLGALVELIIIVFLYYEFSKKKSFVRKIK